MTGKSTESEDDSDPDILDICLDDDLDETPRTPTLDGQPPVVDYSFRVPGDWVLSGPLPGWNFSGRRFGTQQEAYAWAVGKFGAARVSNHYGGMGRWAVVIRPQKSG